MLHNIITQSVSSTYTLFDIILCIQGIFFTSFIMMRCLVGFHFGLVRSFAQSLNRSFFFPLSLLSFSFPVVFSCEHIYNKCIQRLCIYSFTSICFRCCFFTIAYKPYFTFVFIDVHFRKT